MTFFSRKFRGARGWMQGNLKTRCVAEMIHERVGTGNDTVQCYLGLREPWEGEGRLVGTKGMAISKTLGSFGSVCLNISSFGSHLTCKEGLCSYWLVFNTLNTSNLRDKGFVYVTACCANLDCRYLRQLITFTGGKQRVTDS